MQDDTFKNDPHRYHSSQITPVDYVKQFTPILDFDYDIPDICGIRIGESPDFQWQAAVQKHQTGDYYYDYALEDFNAFIECDSEFEHDDYVSEIRIALPFMEWSYEDVKALYNYISKSFRFKTRNAEYSFEDHFLSDVQIQLSNSLYKISIFKECHDGQESLMIKISPTRKELVIYHTLNELVSSKEKDPIFMDTIDAILAKYYNKEKYNSKKEKLVVYIDMDNVLVDFPSAIPLIPKETLEKYDNHADNVPGIFSMMKPVEGAVEAYQFLSKHFDVYILSTAPWDNPSSWSDKLLWVKQYLGDAAYKRLILSHHKDLNRGDFLIDDRVKNGASNFEGTLIRFGSEDFPDWETVLYYFIAILEKRRAVLTEEEIDNIKLPLSDVDYIRLYAAGEKAYQSWWHDREELYDAYEKLEMKYFDIHFPNCPVGYDEIFWCLPPSITVDNVDELNDPVARYTACQELAEQYRFSRMLSKALESHPKLRELMESVADEENTAGAQHPDNN
jgi:5'(3')-deoxyribonucleotidase